MTMSSGFKLTLDAQDAEALMTPNPVTIAQDSTVESAADFFTRCGFSAAPVVDDKNCVVGVLSQTDLVRAQAHPKVQAALTADPNLRGPEEASSGPNLAFRPSTRVSEVMNSSVYVVDTTTPALAVIREMNDKKVRRLFVVNVDRALVGVISAVDILFKLHPHV